MWRTDYGDVSWERTIRAVERVRQRLSRASTVLQKAGIPYAVAGGNAVAAWVSRIDEAAVRDTPGVDEAEYELLQKHLSGVVHSSAYALKEGMPVHGMPLMSLAWRFSFRVLGKLAAYAQITLDDDQRGLIRLSDGNVFGDGIASPTP